MTFLTCVGLIPLHRMSMPFLSLPPGAWHGSHGCLSSGWIQYRLCWIQYLLCWIDTVLALSDTIPAMLQVLNVGGISAAYLLCGLRKYHKFCSYEVGQARRTLVKTGCCFLSEVFFVFFFFFPQKSIILKKLCGNTNSDFPAGAVFCPPSCSGKQHMCPGDSSREG